MSAIAAFARDELGLRLTPMQERAVGEFEEGHQQAVWRWGRRSGKALRLDTPLPTASGWTTMGEVRPGDVVFDERGHHCWVLGCSEPEERPIFRVCFSDGSELLADGEHLWTTLDHAARKTLGRHGLPIPEDWPNYQAVGQPSRVCAHLDSRTLTTAEIAGELSARDGCPGHAIPGARPLWGPETPLSIDPYSLGVRLGRGNMEGGVPAAYLRASISQRNALLRGLLAAGDHVDLFQTTSEPLAESFYELAVSLGFIARIHRAGVGVQVGLETDRLRYITAIEPAGTASVRCIAVSSPSQLYLAGRSMIPTHNSLLADIIALYDALVRDDLRDKMLAGENRVTAVVCPRLDQAQAHIANISARLQHSRQLRGMLTAQTAEDLSFINGSTIRAFPCSARGIRGGAWSACILDELGHFLTSEEGNAAGDRVLEAALPSLAQFGSDGWLICISTPLWKQGAFWTLCKRAESGDFPYMHAMHGSTAVMNPAIPVEWLEQRKLEDPDLYRREFEAEFVDGSSAFLASADVLGCQRKGVNILAPRDGVLYAGAIDPAFSRDNFALGIGHRETDLLVLDGVWTWRREGFEATLDQVVKVAERYRLSSLRTDQWSAQAVIEGLARRNLNCLAVPWDQDGKWQAYARMKALINTRGLQLPDDSALAGELMQLEARTTPAGAVRIAAAGAGHDDRASVLAALVDQLEGPRATAEAMLAVWSAYEPEAAAAYRQERQDPKVW